MKRKASIFATMLIATAILAGGPRAAIAEPGKNQIKAETSTCSNGQNYTFVINGMGKAWQVNGTMNNLIVRRYTLTYFDPDSGELIGSDTYGGGKKSGQREAIISCTGEVTTELVSIGSVRVVATFDAFITPRGQV